MRHGTEHPSCMVVGTPTIQTILFIVYDTDGQDISVNARSLFSDIEIVMSSVAVATAIVLCFQMDNILPETCGPSKQS